MSFVSRDPQPLKSQQEIALEVYQVAIARGLDELAAVIALMTISVESGYWCPWNAADPDSQNYPHDSQSNDGMSVGYFQQQNSAPGANDWWGSMESRMTLAQAADQFLARLSDDYTKSANSPSLAGQYAQQVQGSAFPDRYAQKWTEAWSLLNRALAENPPAPVQPPSPAPQPAPEPVQPQPEAPVTRPDFNEYPRWCTNFEGRSGTKVDLFLLHTEEGNDNADGLASFLISTEGGPNPVSYHYTVSEDPNDHGVTVCDVVDTDNASWSVMSSNQRSINLCFAGSSVNWSRDQWMANDKALDAAAYICARDCLKYGIQVKMLVELDANGNPISDVSTLKLMQACPTTGRTVPPASSTTPPCILLYSPTSGAKGNSTFRFSSPQFIFNWDTTSTIGSIAGYFTVELTLSDGSAVKATTIQFK